MRDGAIYPRETHLSFTAFHAACYADGLQGGNMQRARFGGLMVAAALFGGCSGNGGPVPGSAARPAPQPAAGTAVVPVDAHVVSHDDERGGAPMFAWLSGRPGIQ